MEYIVLLFAAIIIVRAIVRSIKKDSYSYSAWVLHNRYPNAFKMKHGDNFSIAAADYNTLKHIAETSEIVYFGLEDQYAMSEWSNRQTGWAQRVRNLGDDCLNTWGCYRYEFSMKDKAVHPKDHIFTFWQFFTDEFCLDVGLDYTFYERPKKEREQVDHLRKLSIHYKLEVFQSILSFANMGTRKPFFVLAYKRSNADADNFRDFHFGPFIHILEQNNVPYIYEEDIDDLRAKRPNYIFVLEIVTNNDRMLSLSKELLNVCVDFKPVFSFISLEKEYSSSEMKEILHEKELEAQRKALEKATELERKRKEGRPIETPLRLSEAGKDDDNTPDSDLKQLYPLTHYPTSFDSEANDEIIKEDPLETCANQVLETVNYELELNCAKGCYPLITIPSFGCTIWPYRRGITFRRGFTETNFENELKHEFGNQVLVLGDVQLLFASESRPFEPDIALIYRGKCNLRIDLEIDEPYDGLTHCPCHYLGCNDSFRDELFGSHGWLVIRFSERQIHEQRNECLAFIGRLFKAADYDFILSSELQAYGDLQPEPCWTQLEAQKMAEEDLRETYLGHSFKYKEVTEFPTLTVLSDYEEKLIEGNNFNAPSYCNREVFSFGLSTEEEFNDETLNSVGYNKKNSSPLDVDICFDAYKHLYTYKGIPFKAVSSLVSEFFPVFDMPYWSSVKAQERNVSQQYVIEQWTAEGNKSKEVGTFLHKQIENYLLGKKTETDYYFKYCGDEFSVEETISIESEFGFFLNFLNDNKVEPYRTEWRIYDKEYHIAGTIDMICKNNSGGFDIYDWKRSKRLLDDNPFQSGLGELSELEDTRKSHYLLQQNLYKFILEKNYGLRIDSMHLIGLHPIIADNYVDIKLDSVKSYVEYMLKNSNNL